MGLGILGKKIADSINTFIATLTDTEKRAGWGNSVQRENLQKVINNPIEDFISPIGSIVAWHKDLSGVPSLPDNWAECNGQTLSDSESPLNGQTLPDLNGDERFLRGSSVSGTNQEASETVAYQDGNRACLTTWNKISTFDSITTTFTATGIIGGSGGQTRLGKVRPINMSVVWIIRIK